MIVAHALTEPTVDDATMGIDLIETVDDEIARVTADAAYDTVAFYEAAGMRDATVVVPPSKTARVPGAGGECVLSVQIDYRGSASRPVPRRASGRVRGRV